MKINDKFKSKNYGQFKINKIIGNGWYEVKFVDTGYRVKVKECSIVNGYVKDRMVKSVASVGFIGGTKHKAGTKVYKIWQSMINRCYNPRSLSYKHYGMKGVVVCEEWHNFQNYADWYEENKPKDKVGYVVDKDLIDKSLMIYSPETCQFVSPHKNTLEARGIAEKKCKVKNPEGVIFEIDNIHAFCKKMGFPNSAFYRMVNGKRKQYKGWKLA